MEEPTKFDSFLIALWRWIVVAASGYLVAGVFLLALFCLNKYRHDLSRTTQLILAAVLAGPLALAFVWRRLGRVKIFEIEIDLARATPLTDDNLAQGLISVESMSAGPSYDKVMTQQIVKALRSNTAELLQVDIGKEPGWWSTRLFLLAALAEAYTRIRQLVFLNSSEANTPLDDWWY
jgi:hypothetical protein